MRQNYKLKINKPCSENWHEMTDIEKGKFCSTCAKPVIDFTNYSNSELIDTFKNTDKKICGKLYSHQLDTPLVNNYKKRHSSFIYKILSASILVGFSKVSSSQKADTVVNQPVRILDTLISTQPSIELTKTRLIKGFVLGDDNDSIPFATIHLKSTNISVASNINGAYQITIPENYDSNIITLIISSVGHEDVKHTYRRTSSEVIFSDIKLRSQLMILGGIHLIEKRKWWQRKRRY